MKFIYFTCLLKSRFVAYTLVLLFFIGGYFYEDFLNTRSIEYNNNSSYDSNGEVLLSVVNPLKTFTKFEDTNLIISTFATIEPMNSFEPQYQLILDSYNDEFKNLVDQFEREVYQLLIKGKEEYIQHKGNVFRLMGLSNLYRNKFSLLERDLDDGFLVLLRSFNDTLEEHSYGTNIVNDLENYFDYYKEKFITDLASKISGSL